MERSVLSVKFFNCTKMVFYNKRVLVPKLLVMDFFFLTFSVRKKMIVAIYSRTISDRYLEPNISRKKISACIERRRNKYSASVLIKRIDVIKKFRNLKSNIRKSF